MISSKLQRVKQKLVEQCTHCNGISCNICLSTGLRFSKYHDAGIPIDYWDKPWKDFSGDKNFKQIISEKIKDINNVYDNGESYAFIGNLGVGKTFACSAILKTAIVNGYSAHYTNMADVVTLLLSKSNDTSEYFKKLKEVDFLCLDEFDGRWISSSEKSQMIFGSLMENILRSRFQNQLPTIICSNSPDIDSVLSDDFSRTFSSLRSKYMKVFSVSGKDFRKAGKKNES